MVIKTLGEVMVGLTAVLVHHRFLNEHKIDNKVFKTMKMEQRIGVLGIVLIILGAILEIQAL